MFGMRRQPSMPPADLRTDNTGGGRAMADFELVIGNKNYSSWSLRPWLAMTHFGVPFRETMVLLDTPTMKDELLTHSPAGRVPVLKHGDLVIWDSLAILEYLAERFPEHGFWPADRAARARARSLAAEMHAGFPDLRAELPMDCRARRPDHRWSDAAAADIDRVKAIWAETRQTFGAGGAFLCGEFGAVDAMFAPVVSRFVTYSVTLDGAAADYRDAVWNLPAMQAWLSAAAIEAAVLPVI